MSLGSAQLFYRHNQVIVPSLTAIRSAARQYPFPFGVQFSGQINLAIANEDTVLRDGAKPVYTHTTGRLGANYEKSYALCRQVLYLSWLNGARFFNWETGELIRAKKELIPSPLGTFSARASKLIEGFGPTGPVQTPVALISEFSNVWRPPATTPDKHINPHIPNFKSGMLLYSQIIDKMQAIGAPDLIVQINDAGEMRGKDKYIEQRDKT